MNLPIEPMSPFARLAKFSCPMVYEQMIDPSDPVAKHTSTTAFLRRNAKIILLCLCISILGILVCLVAGTVLSSLTPFRATLVTMQKKFYAPLWARLRSSSLSLSFDWWRWSTQEMNCSQMFYFQMSTYASRSLSPCPLMCSQTIVNKTNILHISLSSFSLAKEMHRGQDGWVRSIDEGIRRSADIACVFYWCLFTPPTVSIVQARERLRISS